MLAAFARTTGQMGEADSLSYFLSTPDAVKKTPCLLLIKDGNDSACSLSGAVLLFEYRCAVAHSRVFATIEGSGRRGVLAQPEMRARIAGIAARTLMAQGAQIVHLAFSETHHSDGNRDEVDEGTACETIAAELTNGAGSVSSSEWTFKEYPIPSYLPLFRDFDETLARLGRRTRSNLRYYRRRAEKDLGSYFLDAPRITREEFLAFNRECTYAVTDALAGFRYDVLQSQPNHGIRGVRDRDGRWLSLTGIRRQNGFVEMDWQMNRAGMPAASLATVLRSYLIEDEIARGSTRLYMEGGTPQPILRSFLRQRVSEVTVRRRSAYVRLLARFAPRIFPPRNYIGTILRDESLQWNRL